MTNESNIHRYACGENGNLAATILGSNSKCLNCERKTAIHL